MAKETAKLYKVKVVPKDLKQIPDVLPFNQFISGEPKEVELTKMEINRCMNFGDVFIDGEEDEPINIETFKDIVEFEEKEDEPGTDPEPEKPSQHKAATVKGAVNGAVSMHTAPADTAKTEEKSE